MKAITAAVLVLLIFSVSAFAEEAPAELVDFVNAEITSFSDDATIIQAVIAENAKGKTLDQIKSQDGTWKGTAGLTDFMTTILSSDLADYLRGLQEDYDFLAEIFVMDDQGANVAMTDKTSDYWQGDEAKFQNSFADGSGAVFIDEVEFDDSAQCYMVQVSIPVLENGKAIGAITFGVDLDRFEETM